MLVLSIVIGVAITAGKEADGLKEEGDDETESLVQVSRRGRLLPLESMSC
jgi:hypothetical protein